MLVHDVRGSFEEEICPHLDAAHNLARWLTHNPEDADDVVQEAFMRAFRFFGGFRGGNARSWLLCIVRNTFYTWVQENRLKSQETEFDEETIGPDPKTASPEDILLRSDLRDLLR